MQRKFLIPAVLLFAFAAATPTYVSAQMRPVSALRTRIQTVRERGTHIHDHSARPHSNVATVRS